MNNLFFAQRATRAYLLAAILSSGALVGCSALQSQSTPTPTAKPAATATIAPTLALPTLTPLPSPTTAPAKPTSPSGDGAGKPTAVPPKPTLTPTPVPELKMMSVTTSDKNEKQFYEINRNTPKLQGGKSPAAVTAFNNYIEGILSKEVAKHKAEFIKNGKPTGFEGHNSLDTSYDILTLNQSYVSLRLNYFSYYAGAAHPNTNSVAINYDLDKRAPVLLSEQFKPGTTFIKSISTYVNQELEKTLADSFFKEGATAKAENFKNWGVTENGLVMHFDAYQVAAYAVGPQEVVIPKSALTAILNPSGQLAKYAK
ncbi:MAG: DUF3298 and DUF4163 domain-containing protein [Anaerolineae bacterium]|nr:DUF3298 and DUF4163 domain-containing protein [Anaerolineae bacterium]